MRTVIVTGGCGFIGSHFVRLLIQRTEFCVINLDNLTYAGDLSRLHDLSEGEQYLMIKGDIADRGLLEKLFKEERPWGIVNFAAESHVDRSILDSSSFLHSNIYGVQTLLEVARTNSLKRFLQVSTDEVYGDADGEETFKENSPLSPSNPYAASKAAADLLCMAYRRTYGVPILIVRSSNNYGPFQFPEKLIPLIIRNALRGDNLPIYGDGGQKRVWLYVEDNAKAIHRILERGKVGSIYNVGTGEEKTNLDVVKTICQYLAEETNRDLGDLLDLIQSVADRPGHDRRYAMDANKALFELQWEPEHSFDTAIKDTVSWYVQNQKWIEHVISGEYRTYVDAVYKHAWKQNGS